MSSKSVIKYFVVYLYSAFAAAAGGSIAALSAVLTGQVIGALDYTPRQLMGIAVGGAIAAVLAYLKRSPLPKLQVTEAGEIDIVTTTTVTARPSADVGASAEPPTVTANTIVEAHTEPK